MKNPLIWIIQLPIKAYALFISPWLGNNCRYQPTCSAYMVQALNEHGVLKGLYLGTKRLFRCHPYTKCCGYDPVPGNFAKKP